MVWFSSISGTYACLCDCELSRYVGIIHATWTPCHPFPLLSKYVQRSLTLAHTQHVMLCTETETDCLIKCKLVSRQMRIYPYIYSSQFSATRTHCALDSLFSLSLFFAALFGSLDTRILYNIPRANRLLAVVVHFIEGARAHDSHTARLRRDSFFGYIVVFVVWYILI